MPKFIISTIQENLDSGGSIKYGIFILAAWCYYSDKGVDSKNNPIEIIDNRKEELHEKAKKYEQDKLSFLRIRDIFGNLVDKERFTKTYIEMLDDLYNGAAIREQMRQISQNNA